MWSYEFFVGGNGGDIVFMKYRDDLGRWTSLTSTEQGTMNKRVDGSQGVHCSLLICSLLVAE